MTQSELQAEIIRLRERLAQSEARLANAEARLALLEGRSSAFVAVPMMPQPVVVPSSPQPPWMPPTWAASSDLTASMKN